MKNFIQKEMWIPYQAHQMYSLVNNIETYPEFIKGCFETQVHSKSDEKVIASLIFKKGPLKYSFTTENNMVPNQSIFMTLTEGPFKSLEGTWEFNSIDENNTPGCHIVFKIEYEFSHSLLDVAFKPSVNLLADKLVTAFCRQAKSIYG